MVIIPGETATCTFLVDYASSVISKAVVTFYQSGKTVIEKITTSKTSVDSSHTSIAFDLTQADTLKIANHMPCLVQLNLLTSSGDRITGEPTKVDVGEQHYRKVII